MLEININFYNMCQMFKHNDIYFVQTQIYNRIPAYERYLFKYWIILIQFRFE